MPGGEDLNLGILSFADNFWILARSPQMATLMTEAWLRILNKSGLEVPVSEMEWCHTYPTYIGTLRVRGTLIPCRERADGLKVLGTFIAFDRSCTNEVCNRIQRAWRTWAVHKHMLTNPKISLSKRLKALDRCVRPALTYCIGSLHISSSGLSRLSKCHNTMLRRIIRPPTADSAAEYMKNAMSLVAATRTRYDIEPWTQTCRRLSHAWAGHLQGIAQSSCDRIAYRVLRYRDRTWMTSMERSLGSQLHHRTVGIWRWERDFYNFYGFDWLAKPYSKQSWADGQRAWLEWRHTLR